MPLRSTALEERGWSTKWEVITYVECGGCEYKRTKMQENWEQRFLPEAQLSNIWCDNCLRAWK